MPQTKNTTSPHVSIDPFTELVTTQKLQHDEVMKEIAGVKSDVMDVKNGITAQIENHNLRLMALETFRQTKAADEKIISWSESSAWVDDFRKRWKWIVGLVGLASGVFVYVIDHILPLIHIR